MRSAFLTLVAATVVAIVMTAAWDKREVVAAVGLPATRATAPVEPLQLVCRSVAVDAPVGRVRIVRATQDEPVTVVVNGRSRTIAPGESETTVPEASGRVEVCLGPGGPRPVTFYGAPLGVLAGELDQFPATPGFVLLRDRPVSALGQVPAIIERAALFGPATPWLLWLGLAGVVLAVPALLLRAMRAAASAPAPPPPPPAPPAPPGA